MTLMVVYQAEHIPQELWENPKKFPDARLREGKRGQLITIYPSDLPRVKIQIFSRDKITVFAPNVLTLAKAILFLQKHFTIWRTEKAQTQPLCIREVGSRPTSDAGPRFYSPEFNVIEEWTYNKENPRRFSTKHTMTWRTVKVGAT